MGRAVGVPQDSDLASNSRDNKRIVPLAVVLHKTIGRYSGPDSGDSQYIENHELAHYVIGEDDGEWEQVLDDEVFAAHCNGANNAAIGIEFSDLDPHGELNSWQVLCLAHLMDEFNQRLDIPKVYVDPNSAEFASIRVDDRNFRGWISHYNVKPWSGIQHHDRIPIESWNKALYLSQTPEEDDDMRTDEFDARMALTNPPGKKGWQAAMRMQVPLLETLYNQNRAIMAKLGMDPNAPGLVFDDPND